MHVEMKRHKNETEYRFVGFGDFFVYDDKLYCKHNHRRAEDTLKTTGGNFRYFKSGDIVYSVKKIIVEY